MFCGGHEQQTRWILATQMDEEVDDIEQIPRIQYAGHGHCTQVTGEFRLVENEYSINGWTG